MLHKLVKLVWCHRLATSISVRHLLGDNLCNIITKSVTPVLGVLSINVSVQITPVIKTRGTYTRIRPGSKVNIEEGGGTQQQS